MRYGRLGYRYAIVVRSAQIPPPKRGAARAIGPASADASPTS